MNIDIIETIRTKYSGLYVAFEYNEQRGFFNITENGEVIAYGGDVWITEECLDAVKVEPLARGVSIYRLRPDLAKKAHDFA